MTSENLEHPCKQTCSGWKQGFEAGQSSRPPIKWPTETDVFSASIKDADHGSPYNVGFKAGVEWLKSFVERGTK